MKFSSHLRIPDTVVISFFFSSVQQTVPPQRYNRSVGNALWNAVTAARKQLGGVKIGPDKGGGKDSSKDAGGDDRKLRAVHGEKARNPYTSVMIQKDSRRTADVSLRLSTFLGRHASLRPRV